MADGRVNNGGARPGAGRKPKPVEDAQTSVLLRLFDEKAEEGVVKAVIRKARQGDVAAATWLWDRKYGKVKEQVEQRTDMTIRVIRVRTPIDAPGATPGTASDQG